MKFKSSKTYTHNNGLSCAFRQWRADSHCRYLHGYALSVKITFIGALDERNWVYDYGGLKPVKKFLEDTFDHKTIVAVDDPAFELFEQTEKDGLIQMTILPAVGCEKFAQFIFEMINPIILENTKGRVKVDSVEVKEHESNGAEVIND